jgi:predicted O-methyltransferase YrrM
MKGLLKYIVSMADVIAAPLVLIGSIILKTTRQIGIAKLPVSRKIFDLIGVFPIVNHYYEPLFKRGQISTSLRDDRFLRGINFNDKEQLELLEQFEYNSELLNFPMEKPDSSLPPHFYYNNPNFKSGDAEYLYNIIRFFKPSQIIEIGSGYSTLIAHEAIVKNETENGSFSCSHISIEPYQRNWLEKIGVNVIRELVENIDIERFARLNRNDILFIDSTHIIKPQGDVLYEYLQILPSLNPGVIIHIHDIFTPKDYLDEWILDEVRFWNEQYLLEAFLSFNHQFKIIGALNYLAHHYLKELSSKCPIYSKESSSREPGSMWLQKI